MPTIKYIPEKEHYFKKIKELCKVKGFEVIRVGKQNDGGYIMLNDFNNKEIAYSFGIAEDISWDKCIVIKEWMCFVMILQ